MRKIFVRSFAVLTILAIVLGMLPMALLAQPPQPVAEDAVLAKPKNVKPKDAPNPIDYKRLEKREQLLLQGKFAEAAALAKTGSDTLLVILVEFAGSDTATWSPGDIWDPIGYPGAEDWEDLGDCSGIITETQEFTFTGPLHNQLVKPTSMDHPGYNAMWTEDFSRNFYWEMLFGNGAFSEYTMENDQQVTIDLRGLSMRQYFEEQSKGMYTLDGDVVGWVQVPHSQAYYGADACPGGRTSGYSSVADGFFPGGGDPRDLASDAVDAIVASDPTFDWAQYDQNADGVLDRVMIVHAGYGEEDSTDLLWESGQGEHAIWSHSWSVYPYHDIGDTGLQIGPYTMMPENGMVGVFAHEMAHNLGCRDLYAYNPGETSAGFWTLMADDWGGGWPHSAVPPGMDPWHKYLLGWNDPVVLDTMSPETELILGQACAPPDMTSDSVIINLPPQIEQPVVPTSGMYMWYGGKSNYRDAKLTIATPWDFTSVTSPTLTFNGWYDIEEGWDFGFVQASTDGGTTWTSLPGTTSTEDHDPDSYFIDELPGYTGWSDGWVEETVDLSAYAGESAVLLRFRYETDPNTLGTGWYIDDVAVMDGTTTLFSDDFEEMDSLWVAEDWTWTDGYAVYPHYYIAEWRNPCGFDAGLVSGRYGINDFGMLLWYRNYKYTENEVFNHLADGPGFGPKGACLLVDAHFQPFRSTLSGYVNEVSNLQARIQMRDAAFGLRDTQPFELTERWRKYYPAEEYPSRPAVSTFHDSLGWYPGLEYARRGPGDARLVWSTKHWDASVVVPAPEFYGLAPSQYPAGSPLRFDGEAYGVGSAWYWFPAGIGYGGTTGNPAENNYGVHIQVIEEAADLSWGKVKVWNNTDTFLGEMTVDKESASPGDVLTYMVHVKDATSTSALGTIEIPIPKGTSFVEGSLQGAQFLLDPQSRRDLIDAGRIIWGGRIGGKVLHTADAYITYQVQVDPLAVGPITNEAMVTIKGRSSYKLSATTRLPWVTVDLMAPNFIAPRGKIRYTATVTNESGATLENVNVAVTWVGPAYIIWPNPSSWTIASLGAGETWTKEFTLATFSTATGQVDTTVTVTHPWIEETMASATTEIVR